MKRWGAFAGVAAAIVLATAEPALGADADPCDGASCGAPACWNPKVRARPSLTRAVTVSCRNAVEARLVSAPPDVEVSEVSADWYGIHFDARPDDDAPRWNTAVFEVDGYAETVEVEVSIEVVPTSENAAPVCYGDSVSERTDGNAPVDLFMHPWCYDPDGDDFVMEGGGPGTHPDSPKSVPAGSSEANWRYRTATSSGSETATIFATDVLGARSPDARLEVTIGPGVDRPPQCAPNPWTPGTYTPIYARPGQVRRFGIICTDADSDLFEPLLSSPPERGALVPVAGPPQYGYWGVERWIDATYTPVDDSLEPDRFAFTAAGLRGDGPPGRMAIVPRRLPENGGGSCGYSPASIVTNLPGTAWLRCDDDDGDPLSAEVLTEPQHGIAASPVITPAAYGGDDITIPYVPNPGYEGYDCIKVRVGDGHGLEFNIVIDIWVRPAPPDPPPLPDPPGAPDLPPAPDAPPVDPPLPELTMGSVPGAPPPAPPHGSPHAAPGAAPIVPAHPAGREDVRALAEQALGTTAVKRLSRGGGTEVWARSKLSKNDLLRYGSAPGLAVVCLVDCEIRSDSVLAGVRRLKATRHKTVAAKTPGQAHVVALALSRAERKALRKARKPRGTFKLSVRPAGGKARPVRRSIPIRR